MHLHRRHWLLAASSFATTGLLSACAGLPTSAPRSGPGFVRRRLGTAEVIAVSDGQTARPLDAGFVRNAPLAQVQAALATAGLPTDRIDVPYTCFVVVLDGKHYLLDTGFGDNGPSGTGLLHTHLRQAGIDPERIDAVVLSHLHGDHIQGLRRKDGSLVYPRAHVFVPQAELAYWLDDARRQAVPEAARGGFATAQRVLRDYPASLLHPMQPGHTIAPGLHTLAAPGHSPGHTAVRVGSGADSFTYLGDVAHYPALFVRHPDWQVQFDMDAATARATRRRMLSDAAQHRHWVGGYHFPLPGLGRLRAQGEGFDWQPAR